MNTGSIFIAAALQSKKENLEAKMERYKGHVERDKALIATTAHPEKYASRLRNHEAKLERMKASHAEILRTMEEND